jgi:hypothetical protein
MRARNDMSRDFRCIGAEWSRDRARSAVARFRCAFVVLRRGVQEGRHYHVFGRTELLALLQASIAPGISEALRLAERPAALTVSLNDSSSPSDKVRVVLGPQGPVGLLLPTEGTRGGVSESSPPGAMPESASDAPEVARHLVGTLPDSVLPGATTSLRISLQSDDPGEEAAVPVDQPVGTRIDVVVRPVRGFELAGAGEGTLVVSAPQSTDPLEFPLIAGAEGRGSVRVQAFCQGVAIASLLVEAQIGGSSTTARAARESTEVKVVPRPQPDLSMYIFEKGSELSFMLQSADGHLQMKKFGPVQLASSPREHFRTFFKDIENLPLGTPEQRRTAKRRMETKGAKLFEDVLPEDLRALLWEQRERITTVQITSEEPWIPWEVCRLTGRTDGRVEGGKFFAEAFSVTRWLYGVSAAPRLRLGDLALVVPGDSGLENAAAEKAFVRGLAGPGRRITDVPATYGDVTDAMITGRFDAWHFTGHARADENTDADQSAIELANREALTPEDVAGEVENVLAPRPFVFLNACQSARGGLSLTGVGGWAQRLLKPNSTDRAASAFVGSYWMVDDEAAFRFAQALYQGLIAGKPIGQAAREARLAIRGEEDPTWLAYTVYADPHATVGG